MIIFYTLYGGCFISGKLALKKYIGKFTIIHTMVIKLLWNGYVMVVEWLFIYVTLVSYGLSDYVLVIHGFTHYDYFKICCCFIKIYIKYVAGYSSKKYDVKVSGIEGGSARGCGSKEVSVIGHGYLWIQKFGTVIYMKKKGGVGGDKKYCRVGIDYIEKGKEGCMIKKLKVVKKKK
eukprot:218031_1